MMRDLESGGALGACSRGFLPRMEGGMPMKSESAKGFYDTTLTKFFYRKPPLFRVPMIQPLLEFIESLLFLRRRCKDRTPGSVRVEGLRLPGRFCGQCEHSSTG